MKASFRLIALLILLTGVFGTPAAAADKFVAVVITGDLPRYQTAHEAFLKILKAGGLTKDKVDIYVQTPNPDPMSWANSIRKAVGVGADLIVTYGAPATLVAKREARSIPILFADVYDPVGLGLVKDLAVPGGDLSGVSNKTPIETLLRTYVEVYKGKRLGALFSPQDQGSVLQVEDLEGAAPKFGLSVVRAGVQSVSQIPAVCQKLVGEVDGLFVSDSALLALDLPAIVGLAAKHRVPIITQVPGMAEMGALLTLEADPAEQGQLPGVHALQILGAGQKALALPIRTPKKVSLVINLKTARDLNLTVPFQALSNATRVIK